MTMRPITVSITTRNRPPALARCVRSLASIADLVDRVIVFDDASDPPLDVTVVERAAEEARLAVVVIRAERHEGTAAGKNRIARAAGTRYLLSLDDDAFLVGDAAVRSACGVLDRDPGVAAIAFAQADAAGRRYPDSQQPGATDVPSYVAAFIGFACLIVRERLLAIGGYRDGFVIHGEEREVCLRWLDRGWRVVYLPGAPVAHVADSTNRDPRQYVRYVMRNDCLAALHNEPLTRAALLVPYKVWCFTRMRAQLPGGDPGGVTWMLAELLKAAPGVLRARRPVSRATLKTWRSLALSPQRYLPPAAQS